MTILDQRSDAERALGEATRRFGPDILRSPVQTRAIVADLVGADGGDHRQQLRALHAAVEVLRDAPVNRADAVGRDLPQPRFETIALGQTHQWKYRGQVLPHHHTVHTTLELTERGRDASGIYAIANASLWVDGQRIYEATGLGVRIVSGDV